MVPLIVTLTAVSAPALAVPAAVTGGFFDGGSPSVSAPGSYTNNGTNVQESLVYTVTPSPALTASVSTSNGTSGNAYWGDPGERGQEDGTNGYYFEVLGPTSTVNVQVHASGSVQTSAGPTGNTNSGFFSETAYSAFGVYLTPGKQSPLTFADALIDGFWAGRGNVGQPPDIEFANNTANVSGSPDTGFSGTWTDNDQISVSINTVYFVAIDAQAAAGSNGGAISAEATLDPWFSIGAGVTNPGDYSFVFSDGIGNSPAGAAVPEPASGLLLAIALGGLAMFRRRPV